MGPNLFVCNENSAYIMSRVTAHAMMSCMHCEACTCRQAGHLYMNVGCQKLLMDILYASAEQYLSKLTASHFSTLNTKDANQNVQKWILFPMHNKNEANCNKHLRICAEEPVAPLYKR